MGHASITITLDRYGHLMPGNEADAAEPLDAYIARERESSGLSWPRSNR
jgi:integrase